MRKFKNCNHLNVRYSAIQAKPDCSSRITVAYSLRVRLSETFAAFKPNPDFAATLRAPEACL